MLQEGDILAKKYRIVKLLGEGGMGAVYEAQHELIGKRIAIKTLRPHLDQSSDAVSRFTREARSAGTIGHPSIIDIHDIGEAPDGTLFIVMEYLEGRSLGDVLNSDSTVPLPFAAYVVCQVLSALSAAHEKNIIHRDIKPDNIFLVEKGQLLPEIKLLDFGISKIINRNDPSFSMTGTGEIVGTPYYLSPEQARGSDDLDHRIDIYSAGVVLFECVTGSRPFVANNFLALITELVMSPPPMPKTLRPDLPTELEQVILKAIAKDREKRYESAQHMLNALLPFVDDNAKGYLTLGKDSGAYAATPIGVESSTGTTLPPSSIAVGGSSTVEPRPNDQTGERDTEPYTSDAETHISDTAKLTHRNQQISLVSEPSHEADALGSGTNMAWQSRTEPAAASSRRMLLIVGLLLAAFVVVIGAVAVIWLVVAARAAHHEPTSPPRPPITATSPDPTQRPVESSSSRDAGGEATAVEPVETQEIVVSLEGVPEGAQVFLDGTLVEGRELRVPRTGGTHEVRVVQGDRELWRQRVNFENNEAVAVGLPLILGGSDAGDSAGAQPPGDGSVQPSKAVAPRLGAGRRTGRGTGRTKQPTGLRSRFNREFD